MNNPIPGQRFCWSWGRGDGTAPESFTARGVMEKMFGEFLTEQKQANTLLRTIARERGVKIEPVEIH